MHHVGRAGNCPDQRLFIHEVGLDKLKLVEEVTEGFTDRRKLGLVCLVANSTTDAETTVLKELQAGVRSDVAGDSGESNDRFVRGVDHYN